MRYELVKVETDMFLTEASFISPNGDDYRRVLDEMYKKGWRYAGWIPIGQNGRGQLMSIDLVFERDD